ncbi:acyl carrier protein [Streptomyces sp. NBC_01334]|uniref:acyl carrier protein n=1 Tax=Streptomyces sp. NBC_01334 TaxID=2903827 RepID=UPI002E0FCE31|nr:acyl carrier protein [Streptomyces sp. NBC_01334]
MSDDGVKTRPDPYAGPSSGLPSEPPVTPPGQAMEDQVRAAWTEVLGHDDFDDDTPFVEAGGHSLKATQVLMRLRRKLGVRLPNRLFFDHPTVRELAVAVERIAATSPRV